MKTIFKSLFFSMAILGGLAACNNRSQMEETRLRDSLYQDSLRKDSIQREMEQPDDSLLMDDSLSTNNREMRTP
jgi:hypothetical protein